MRPAERHLTPLVIWEDDAWGAAALYVGRAESSLVDTCRITRRPKALSTPYKQTRLMSLGDAAGAL